MKKFLAVAAILAVTSANAEELKFGDLNYFLKQGQFNVAADFIVNNETARQNEAEDVDVDNYFLNTNFGYALTDSFNLTFGLDAVLMGETEIDDGESADTMGLQNPKFGANFRLLNQKDSGLNLDFGAVAKVKLIDREVATGNDDDGNMLNPALSNYAEPRNTLALTARLGKKWNEANEFYLVAGADYHMDGEYELLGNEDDADVDFDSSIDYKLGGFYQYRPVYEFMMTFGLTATRVSDADVEVDNNDFTFEEHMDYQFSFDAKYLVSEAIIAKFIFKHDKRDDIDIDGGEDLDKRRSVQYGFGVDFLF